MVSTPRRDALHIVLLLAATLLCYANAFCTAFVFDDIEYIVNTTRFDPVSKQVITGRRVVPQLTFLANYWTSRVLTGDGRDPRAFKITNVIIHAAAGLALWGVARRALARPPLREHAGDAGPFLAFALALLWLVHPLQTQAVTYAIQRMESLMSLMAMLVVYCVARMADAPASRSRAGWGVVGVACCAIGAASKESMIVAPILALLYDRTFIARSFKAALASRWPYYAALALVLPAVWWALGDPPVVTKGQGVSVGFGIAALPWHKYFLSQPAVILGYLTQSIWPRTLCLDWEWRPTPGFTGVVLPFVIVTALFLLSATALWRRPVLGFCGAWFFVALGPTSSVLPIGDLRMDHRMYLPLAGVIAVALAAAFSLWRSLTKQAAASDRRAGVLACAALAVIAGALGVRTAIRNADYATPATLWASTLVVRPGNERALNNLGAAVAEEVRRFNRPADLAPLRRVAEAIEASLAEHPDDADRYATLGMLYSDLGAPDKAERAFREAVRYSPGHFKGNYRLGILLLNRNDLAGAASCFEAAIASVPDADEAYNDLGTIRMRQGRTEDAERAFKKGLEYSPASAKLRGNLGQLYLMSGRAKDAVPLLEAASKADAANPALALNLARSQALAGDTDGALRTFDALQRSRPGDLEIAAAAAAFRISSDRLDDATRALLQSLESKSDDPASRYRLAMILAQAGRIDDAAKHLRAALAIKPDFAAAKQLLDALTASSTQPR